ncbi:MAG TPA: hypothetical protein VH325_02180 [Bryobacteraceae bacterium]|nr:hypothetical protein [Bryobacteraceae bacterium]
MSKPSDLVWITAEWKTSDLGRRAEFYSFTRLDLMKLASESANWERLSCAISSVVKLREV